MQKLKVFVVQMYVKVDFVVKMDVMDVVNVIVEVVHVVLYSHLMYLNVDWEVMVNILIHFVVHFVDYQHVFVVILVDVVDIVVVVMMHKQLETNSNYTTDMLMENIIKCKQQLQKQNETKIEKIKQYIEHCAYVQERTF